MSFGLLVATTGDGDSAATVAADSAAALASASAFFLSLRSVQAKVIGLPSTNSVVVDVVDFFFPELDFFPLGEGRGF